MGSVKSISEIKAKTGPAQGRTLRNKNVHERGGIRNQCRKETKLVNSRKKKSSTARLTLMYNCVTHQATINILCYVQHQSSLKTRASHPLKFIPLQPSCLTRANKASGQELSLTGIACHLNI